jgi:hypothetical protein
MNMKMEKKMKKLIALAIATSFASISALKAEDAAAPANDAATMPATDSATMPATDSAMPATDSAMPATMPAEHDAAKVAAKREKVIDMIKKKVSDPKKQQSNIDKINAMSDADFMTWLNKKIADKNAKKASESATTPAPSEGSHDESAPLLDDVGEI